MNPRPILSVCLLAAAVNGAPAPAAQERPQHLETYRAQGISQIDEENGRRLWYTTANGRGCTNCHGDDPGKSGKHEKTGKIIEPMALSVNRARFQDAEKIEKWFLRNCKWTFARECNTQEKADILAWLSSQ
jgi:hypothetical protein